MIVILAIENHRDDLIAKVCEKYIQRISGPFKLSIELLPAARIKDPLVQREKESETLQKSLKPGDVVYLCDERGTAMNTTAFSKLLQKELSSARGRIVFGIGGAYGFTSELLNKYKCIKLSDFVLPHHLARLVITEQIYRAYEIDKGSGYHHE